MTYGENGGQIRAGLTTLLHQHRIQQRLGGRGSYTIHETTTPEQRRELGELIQRYRCATLSWCRQAAAAADPRLDLTQHTSQHRRGPAEELQRRLTKSLTEMRIGMPLDNELSTRQDFPLVETWRQVAKAAVLGEHEFHGGAGHGTLSRGQCMTVLTDAAETTRAVIVLDRRYGLIPGWRGISSAKVLENAATACAAFARSKPPDYSADLQGWRPPSALIEGGPLPGIGGVLQAEHNMLVHLGRLPTALNLRRVIDGQRIISRDAARLGREIVPDLVDKWREREETYRALVLETRNLGGLVGNGGYAAAEVALAVSRLRAVRASDLPGPVQLRDLDKLFGKADARIATIIEHGAAERLYFVNAKVPRLAGATDQPVWVTGTRYVPISSPVGSDLLGIIRHDLRPSSPSAANLTGARQSREEFRQAIEHRPSHHSGPPR